VNWDSRKSERLWFSQMKTKKGKSRRQLPEFRSQPSFKRELQAGESAVLPQHGSCIRPPERYSTTLWAVVAAIEQRLLRTRRLSQWINRVVGLSARIHQMNRALSKMDHPKHLILTVLSRNCWSRHLSQRSEGVLSKERGAYIRGERVQSNSGAP
jgi:hypothetical protein